MKLIVSKEALADVDRLCRFLAEKEPRAAQRTSAALQNAIQSLEIFPGRGRPSGIPDIRELVVPFGRSAYLVRYFHNLQREIVVVIRVWHAREAHE